MAEGFFCKKNVDRKQLQRDVEALEGGETAGKDEKLSELKSLLEESVETIDVHREAQELMDICTHGRRAVEIRVNPQATLDDICPQPPLVSQHQPSAERYAALAPRYQRFIALYQRLADLF